MSNTGMSRSGVTGAVAAPCMDVDADAALVRRYLNGDARAFEVLFKKYQTQVFNMVSRMVNGEDAYDLTQDVFCNALKALPNFRGDAKFSTWLYSIARNACLNRIRHRSHVREDSLEGMCEDQPGLEFADDSAGTEEIVETHELQRIVNKVLAALPEEQRLLITLRDFEQLSYEEIAQITNLSLTNVKSRLHRARMAFKCRFKPYLAAIKGG